MSKIETGLVAVYERGTICARDPDHIHEALYARKDGRLQFLAFGGAATEHCAYGRPYEDAEGQRVEPRFASVHTDWMSHAEALAWMERRAITPRFQIEAR